MVSICFDGTNRAPLDINTNHSSIAYLLTTKRGCFMWNSGTSRANYVLIIVEAFPQSRFTKATVVSVTSTI